MTRTPGSKGKHVADWSAVAAYGGLLIFIVLPLWVMAALEAIRFHMFDLTGTPSAAQTSAFLTFIGGGLATSATVLGGLFTWQHNRQERHRLGLQAVIDSLSALSADTPPRLAGALASMVLLGHPRVAIRMLEPAWKARQVDAGTATWLIGQVLVPDRPGRAAMNGDSADLAALQEAAALLTVHADALTNAAPRSFAFPGHFQHSWHTDPELPKDVRKQLLYVMGVMLASKDKDWWCPGGFLPAWPSRVLVECARDDSDQELRSAAALLIAEMYKQIPGHFKESQLYKDAPDTLERILRVGEQARQGKGSQEFVELADQVTKKWEGPTVRIMG